MFQNKRLLIYAPDEFGRGHSKTAEGVLRYGRNPVVGIVDASARAPGPTSWVSERCPFTPMSPGARGAVALPWRRRAAALAAWRNDTLRAGQWA